MTTPAEVMEARAARRDKVRLLRHDGRSRAEIAELMQVTMRTIDRDLQRMGLTTRVAWKWTSRDFFQAQQLLDDGCPYTEVSRTLGIPWRSIQGRFPGRGKHGNPLGANSRAYRLSVELGLELAP